MAGPDLRTPWITGRGAGGLGTGGTGGGGGGGGLVGAVPRGGSLAAGSIPGVTNPAGTIVGNLGNLGDIIKSITGTQVEDLRSQYPQEYFGTLGTLLGNVGRRAAGDISDLLPELQTRAAEAGVAGGYSGSQMENTKLLRDLGLTRYGVEEQARRGLGEIQGLIPKIQPYDPSSIISGIMGAQERADILRAAPDPEAAYQRALQNARGGGGGGLGTGPGGAVRPGTLGGGAGAGLGSVDDILRRYGGGGFGPPVIARGTGPSPYTPYGGMTPYTGATGSEFESDDQWLNNLFGEGGGESPGPVAGGGDYWSGQGGLFGLFPGMDTSGGGSEDFGGSLAYGGGAGYYGEQPEEFNMFS